MIPFTTCLLRAGAIGLLAALVAVAAAGAAEDGAIGARIVRQGVPQAGVLACVACHGGQAEGNEALGAPRLAGVGAPYILEQLDAFADGSRNDAIMAPMAKLLSPAQRRAVAQYLGALAAPSVAPASVPASALGEWIAERGRWSEGVPACVKCHGTNGTGVGAAFPPLAGLPQAYIVEQLDAWKRGARPPGPLELMRAVAGKLSADEIKAVAAYFAAGGAHAAPAPAPRQEAAAAPQGRFFQPPPESAIPDNEFGRMVRLGEAIFRDTAGEAHDYVGNTLTCENCHLDGGRLANASPLWAAYVAYPAYRSKNGHVNTFAERMQGCFRFSMNGKAPPLGDKVLVALETYAYWMSRGAPVGETLPGRGYAKLPAPAQEPDYARGERVYAQRCALCHGADGAGRSARGKTVFPALWGPDSFNWGAGMAAVNNAAAFVKANMPLGLGGTLGDQEAWDVAAFLDGHERPQDPRFVDSVAATRAKFHDSRYSLYGKTVNGRLVGVGTGH